MNLFKILLIFVILFFTIGCSYFHRKHKVTFEFGHSEIKYFTPPKKTYKYSLELISLCSPNDTIQIYSNRVLQVRDVFITAKKGILMDHDWYVGEIGINYVPENIDRNIKNKCSIELELIFYNS